MRPSRGAGAGRERNSMTDKSVEDVMVPLNEYPCVTESQTLRQAIDEMTRAQIRRKGQASMPRVALVFDDSRTHLLGILSRRDIMRGLEPRFLVRHRVQHQRAAFSLSVDPNLSELSHEKIAEHMRKHADRPVKEYVRPIRVTIDRDDHIMKGVSEMVDQNVPLLPVTYEGRVVGVLRSVDVLHEISLLLDS